MPQIGQVPCLIWGTCASNEATLRYALGQSGYCQAAGGVLSGSGEAFDAAFRRVSVMNVAFRGFANNELQFEEFAEFEPVEGDEDQIAVAAMLHAKELWIHDLHMLEIEFLDEPDADRRFLRFGAQPAALVDPHGLF